MAKRTNKAPGGNRTEEIEDGEIAAMPEGDAGIRIPQIKIERMKLPLVGTSPLIMQRWTEKATRDIEGKQAKEAKTAKEKRNPKAEFEAASYKFPGGGFGVPARSFKAAAVAACRYVDGVPMTVGKGAFFVLSQEQKTDDGLVKLKHGEAPMMRTDHVRLAGGGSCDLRYRPMFKEWSVTLDIEYNSSVISPAQIMNLFNIAGFHCGIGEWRPSAPKSMSGEFGRFSVAGVVGVSN